MGSSALGTFEKRSELMRLQGGGDEVRWELEHILWGITVHKKGFGFYSERDVTPCQGPEQRCDLIRCFKDCLFLGWLISHKIVREPHFEEIIRVHGEWN